jgi:hypothetical protein
LLIGTLDGYVLTYDIRCNIIANIKQLQLRGEPVSVSGIYAGKYENSSTKNVVAVTYPSAFY